MLRRHAAVLAAILFVVTSLGCASAPKRFARASADFHAYADRYEAKCVAVAAGRPCDCAAWQRAVTELKKAVAAYYEHNVKLRVPGGVGWERLQKAAEATKEAECGRR